MRLVIATRNPGKVRELRRILDAYPELHLVGLQELGVAEAPEEDGLETFDTFEANALAKAEYFASLLRQPVLADDSGLCVDALGGAPGVHSRRFAPEPLERGLGQDGANNALLLERLAVVPQPRRGARYVCAVAFAAPGAPPFVVRGECVGRILEAPRGHGGFGYDPLFWVDGEERSFGEVPPARKDAISHRGRAARAAAERLRTGLTTG